MGNLWLVPLGLFLCGFAYLVLERIVVKWTCSTLLKGRVKLIHRKGQSEATGGVMKTITQRDVMEISLLILTWVVGAATSVVSILCMMETRHDTIHARATMLIPWCHLIVPYYIIDTYAMTTIFMKQEHVIHRRLRTKIILYIQKKWPFLLHHIFVALSYPLMVNDHLRGFKGDFYGAGLLAQDLSNPLLANAKILNILGLTNNILYAVNGALLIVTFLASRILFVPISVSIYAAQYHGWDVMQALRSMRMICHLCNALQFCIQFYWFVLLLRMAARVVGGWLWGVEEKVNQESRRLKGD